MDDEIWHPGNSNHAVRFKRQNRSPPGGCAARTYVARCCDPVHGGCKPVVAGHGSIHTFLQRVVKGEPDEKDCHCRSCRAYTRCMSACDYYSRSKCAHT